jgi:hypothetical protein
MKYMFITKSFSQFTKSDPGSELHSGFGISEYKTEDLCRKVSLTELIYGCTRARSENGQ